MSASEIITIIKEINDHVTVKYSGAIIDYLAEKKKAHLSFERELFNEMDKAVQQLINNMSRLFNATCEESESFKKIQMQCSQYNKWKKNKYDAHLLKIEQLEKGVDQFIRKAFDAKVLDQHTLFDEALSNSLNMNIANKNVVEEKKQKSQHANNNNIYPPANINLFNDNIKQSTIFSNNSQNINNIKLPQPSNDKEKTHQNGSIPFPILPQPLNNVNNIPLYLPPLPLLQINNQNISNTQDKTYNNQPQLPISFSTTKLKPPINITNGLNDIDIDLNKTNNIVFSMDFQKSNNMKKKQNLALSSNKKNQMPPPKPPPPPPQITTDGSASELSDTSNMYSSDSTMKNGKHHQMTDNFAGKMKRKMSTRKSGAKRKKKRKFRKMCGDDNTLNATNKSNKRSCRRYQCEYCDKQYKQKMSYIKHYNHHMKTNPNIQCNFCLNKFNDKEELKRHVNEFSAGISVDDGFYQCCKCTMRFEIKEELTSHISSQHNVLTVGDERNKSVEFI